MKVDLILIRGQKCEKCGAHKSHPSYLQLHHITYARLFNEEPSDLLLLCGKCHLHEHGLLKAKKKAAPPRKTRVKTPPAMSKKDRALQARYDAMRAKK